MAARRGHDAVKGSSVGQLKHAALLRRVCKMNEQHPISWDFNWQQEVFDDKQGDLRKENLTSLLHRMDKVKQEHSADLKARAQRNRRLERQLISSNVLITDSTVQHSCHWDGSIHVDPQLQNSLRRPPSLDSTPSVTMCFRDSKGHDRTMHPKSWEPAKEVGGYFGTFSNPTPAAGLKRHTRRQFMKQLCEHIDKIEQEYRDIESMESISSALSDHKARLGADVYQLRKQYTRLHLGKEPDVRTSLSLSASPSSHGRKIRPEAAPL